MLNKGSIIDLVSRVWGAKIPIGFWINLWLFLFTFIVFVSGLVLVDKLVVDKDSPGWGSYVLAGWLVFTVGTLLHLLFYRVIRRKNPRWVKSLVENFST